MIDLTDSNDSSLPCRTGAVVLWSSEVQFCLFYIFSRITFQQVKQNAQYHISASVYNPHLPSLLSDA